MSDSFPHGTISLLLSDYTEDSEAAQARAFLKADLVLLGLLAQDTQVAFHSILTVGPVTYADTQSMERVTVMFAEEARSISYVVSRKASGEYIFKRKPHKVGEQSRREGEHKRAAS